MLSSFWGSSLLHTVLARDVSASFWSALRVCSQLLTVAKDCSPISEKSFPFMQGRRTAKSACSSWWVSLLLNNAAFRLQGSICCFVLSLVSLYSFERTYFRRCWSFLVRKRRWMHTPLSFNQSLLAEVVIGRWLEKKYAILCFSWGRHSWLWPKHGKQRVQRQHGRAHSSWNRRCAGDDGSEEG